MLDTIPNEEKMTALVGKSLYNVWKIYLPRKAL